LIPQPSDPPLGVNTTTILQVKDLRFKQKNTGDQARYCGEYGVYTGEMPNELTHFDDSGASRMVDVGEKAITARMARASGKVEMQPETLKRIRDRGFAKGDVLEVARLAGIMAAKKTGELIPLCHPLPLDAVTIGFSFPNDKTVSIEAEVRVTAKTGVEMEALAAVSVAALTIYDMCKAVDRGMVISEICLKEKSGGRSGHFVREG
jgi:cyclic pyranopterin phosphate synthase